VKKRARSGKLPPVPKAAVGDIEVHYEEHGSGMPLLLICGIPAVLGDWGPIPRGLRGKRRIISFDNRGSGETTATAAPYSMEQLAGDAVGLLDHLHIGRADVFGFSMGGMIAQEMALRWPHRVDRLILGCTNPGLENSAPEPRETAKAFAMETDDWGERMRALAPFAFREDIDPQQLADFVEKKTGDVQSPEGYRGQIAAVRGHETYDRLGEIASPTMVITGSRDRVIPALNSDVLAEAIPGARLEILEGAGHLFFIEEPERTIELVEDFLGSTPGPR
jgi:pimeloyl-ACP methyl ester carboxylesterase